MSDPTVRTAGRIDLLTAETSEGAQELQRRHATDKNELGREVGAVLRLPNQWTLIVATMRQ
jgi:hypothetical protein